MILSRYSDKAYMIQTGFFFNLKHLVHRHICDPHVPLMIDRYAVRHVEETCSPAGQNVAGFWAQSDNGVRQNGTLLHVLIVERFVKRAKQFGWIYFTRSLGKSTFFYLTSRPTRGSLGGKSRAARPCLWPLRSLVRDAVSDSLAIPPLLRVC